MSSAFLDMAEMRALDHVIMTMRDWHDQLKKFIDMYNRDMLPEMGRITHDQAMEKALTEYDKFRVIQDKELMSDFDREIELLMNKNE